VLKDHCKEVKIAKDVKEALKISHPGSPPDIILLDIMLPEVDGYEVCKQPKGGPNTCNIPIIFLIEKSEVKEGYRFEMGAVDYTIKPVSPAIVLARVKLTWK
jgi:putative two-component system response regulator